MNRLKSCQAYLVPFPLAVRAKVEAEQIRARSVFIATRQTPEHRKDLEKNVAAYIMQVFLAFASALARLAQNGQFDIRSVESSCLQFLPLIAHDVYDEEVWRDRGILAKGILRKSEVFKETLRQLENTPQWGEYRALVRSLEETLLADLERLARSESSAIDNTHAPDEDIFDWVNVSLDPLFGDHFASQAAPPEGPRRDSPHDSEALPAVSSSSLGDSPGGLEGFRRNLKREVNRHFAALRLAESTRLIASNTMREEAVRAVKQIWPQDRDGVEQTLWPVLSRYAESVFDQIARARLAKTKFRTSKFKFTQWLELHAVPAVVDDICTPVAGQLHITVQHLVDSVGELKWSDHVDGTKRQFWLILGETFGSAHTDDLRNRLRTQLRGRISHWEGRFIEGRSIPPVSATPSLPPPSNSEKAAARPLVRESAIASGPKDQTIRWLGPNIDHFRKECGWSFDDLANETGIDKKLILGHVNKGKGAYPSTLAKYATAFTGKLKKQVLVAELTSPLK